MHLRGSMGRPGDQRPTTDKRTGIKHWEERNWRHLEACQFEIVIIAKVPRLLLKSGRTVTARVPWAALRGRFTLSFEAHVTTLLQHCRMVRGAARLARIGEDAADGVMRQAVERGLQRRQLQPPNLLDFDEPERSGDSPPRASRRESEADQKALRKVKHAARGPPNFQSFLAALKSALREG